MNQLVCFVVFFEDIGYELFIIYYVFYYQFFYQRLFGQLIYYGGIFIGKFMLINKYKGLIVDGDIVFDIYLNIRNILVEFQIFVIWYYVFQSYCFCFSYQVLFFVIYRL